MTDITKITAPFGLLDEATQNELQAAAEVGADIEHYSGTAHGWQAQEVVGWYSRVVYRVKPEPVRVNIPWPFYESDHKGRAVKIGLHVITCNEDGTEPTVTWEPSE